jgi:NAD-dependent dihydropyrimidine dehydrogenase PreA subunit
MPGVFIDVKVDDSLKDDPEIAKKLEDACPVDIFAARDGHVDVIEEHLDECVLCGLCVHAAPSGTVHVIKLYDGTELEA